MSELIPLSEVTRVPGWRHSPWATGKMIRDGVLGCVRVGRRIYVTTELLQQFIDEHTERAHAERSERIARLKAEVTP